MSLLPAQVGSLLSSAPETLPLIHVRLEPQPDACRIALVTAATLFPRARDQQAALAGLLLRLGCWTESHQVAQDIHSAEGSYWHGIAHRMEPDPSNAGYWFRKAGKHPIFPELHAQARKLLEKSGPEHWRLPALWDPILFIMWCDEAIRAGGQLEAAAQEIQMAEWRLLFHWCATAK